MDSLSISSFVNSVVHLLTEAYAGPPDPSSTWFIDNEPDSGILGIIDHVSAAEASKSVDGSGEPGTTIAANVEHLRWSLAMMNAVLDNQKGPARDIVVLNAGAAIYAANIADSLEAGIARADALIANGAARAKLDALIAYSNTAKIN